MITKLEIRNGTMVWVFCHADNRTVVVPVDPVHLAVLAA